MFLRAFIFSFYKKFQFIISKATLLFILYYFIIHLTSQLFEIKKIKNKKSQLLFYHITCGDYFCARPRGAVVTKAQDPTSKENPPTCCLISCETKGVVYH